MPPSYPQNASESPRSVALVGRRGAWWVGWSASWSSRGALARRTPAVWLALLALLAAVAVTPGCGSDGVRRVKVPGRAPPARLVSGDMDPQASGPADVTEAASAGRATPAAPSETPASPPKNVPKHTPEPVSTPIEEFVAAPPPARTAYGTVTVSASGSRARPGESVSFGLPLAEGLADDPAELRAWLADDLQALPIQARALSRWPGGSLRWVLIDTAIDLPAKGRLNVSIGEADDLPAADDPWTLETLPGGGLVASDGTSSWTLWRAGAGTAAANGSTGGGDQVAGLAARLTDRFDHVYDGFIEPETAVILERGPRRLCFAIEGAHRSRDGLGLPIDFHRFRAVVQLRSGGDEGVGTARVEWSLSNGPLERPPGRLAFTAYELLLEMPEAPREVMFDGHALHNEGRAQLIQLATKPKLILGGEIQPTPRKGEQWMGVRGLDGDLFVQRVEAAQNHPAGLSCGAKGPLTVALLPTLSGREYFLDDASRKTFRLDLIQGAGKSSPEHLARLASPAQITYDTAEVAASGAWGDAGHLYVPGPSTQWSRAKPPAGAPTGWADWGEARAFNTHQSGSPRNQLSVFLEALQSGRNDLFRWAQSRAWHAMDLRPYHIDGFLASEHPDANLYEGIPHGNEPPERRLGRSEIPGRFPEYKQGLPEKGHGYNGFDPEHMTLDDIYECYLLTGSWPALDALRSAGEAMLTWKEVIPSGEIHSARSFGWTLRALVQVHRATGEARYLDAARRLVARADSERGKGPVKYLQRMKPDGRHLADQESDAPFMVAVALHGLSAYWLETADPIVPPMAADLSDFCMGAFRGTGFVADLPLDKPYTGGVADSPLGVSSWIPGALAAAAFITGDHSAVDRTRGYYAQLHGHSKEPVSFGGKDWHWWQAWLVSVSERLGRDAVERP